MLTVLLLLATLFVAYSNGANDNFKGVATLYGSDTATYSAALALATAATFAGAVCSAWFADTLVQAFSGKGLVPDSVAQSRDFLLSVAAGAGATVYLASLLGFPISTTHALIGALAGTGWVAAGPQLNLAHLGVAFLTPLVLGPLLAVMLTVPCYRMLRGLAEKLGIRRESCICAGPAQLEPIRLRGAGARSLAVAAAPPAPGFTVGTVGECQSRYGGTLLGVSGQSLVDSLHYLSAGAVSFARGLNDTPKIVGLMLAAQALEVRMSVLGVATAMALGGLLGARKVALTMSKKITPMNDGQALAANLVTAFLVIIASRLGLPLSTTHVSVGAISGIGIANGSAHARVIKGIVASWVLTLPMAAAAGALTYTLLDAHL